MVLVGRCYLFGRAWVTWAGGGVKPCWYHVSIDKIVDVAVLFVGVLYSFFGVGEDWWSGWTGSEDAWC